MLQCVLCMIVSVATRALNLINDANYQYWHQRADERHGNPPQGNHYQELLVVKDKFGRPQVSLE